MRDESRHVIQVRQMDHGALLALWDGICAGETPGWPQGRAFEYLVLRAFELEGAIVRYPFLVTVGREVVEEIDGAVHAAGLSAIVESKDHAGKISVEPISKLRNQLLRRPAGTVGLLFSRNGFTEPARILAQFLAPQTILLWHGHEVQLAMEKGAIIPALQVKYRMAVETGLPDFDITKGRRYGNGHHM